MRKVILLFTFLTSIASYGQIPFETGYFVDKNNNRQECLIKNYDWRNSPKEILYKIDDNDSVRQKKITELKEFEIYQKSRYVCRLIKIDRSSESLSNLSKYKESEWSDEFVALKVLIWSDVSLYFFKDNKSMRFFYSNSDTGISQLVYKKYINNDDIICYNKLYHRQLLKNINCPETNLQDILKVEYSKKDLIEYFKMICECNDYSYTDYNKLETKMKMNFKITNGLGLFSLSVIDISGDLRDFSINSQLIYRLGFETEILLPFNFNKWGITIEPAYQEYNRDISLENGDVSINYQVVEFPIGVRYYAFNRDDFKLFFNCQIIPNYALTFDSKVDYEFSKKFDVNCGNSFSIGSGIIYKKLSLESRYHFKRDILYEWGGMGADYWGSLFIVGFKF